MQREVAYQERLVVWSLTTRTSTLPNRSHELRTISGSPTLKRGPLHQDSDGGRSCVSLCATAIDNSGQRAVRIDILFQASNALASNFRWLGDMHSIICRRLIARGWKSGLNLEDAVSPNRVTWNEPALLIRGTKISQCATTNTRWVVNIWMYRLTSHFWDWHLKFRHESPPCITLPHHYGSGSKEHEFKHVTP